MNKKYGVEKGQKVLQLYHSSRDVLFQPQDAKNEIVSSIFNNGFRANYSDKGHGVYLSAHSRYSYLWGVNNVFVCDVIVDETDIKRFTSRFHSPFHCSEYLISNPNLVFPRCYFEFEAPKIQSLKMWSDSICRTCHKHPNDMYQPCRCPLNSVIDVGDLVISS